MKKILVVDDHSKIRELICVTLSGIGDYEVLEASSGEEALKIAQSGKPHLILMDVMMQGKLSGFEVTQLLKSSEETSHITIVFLTAKGQKSDLEKGRAVGGDGYFVKPFSPIELINKVEEILG